MATYSDSCDRIEDEPPEADVFLGPGDWHFGDESTCIRTVLGSCVSLTFWHPHRKLGGMCHYMLPDRGGKPAPELDGRYAEEAMALLVREMRAAGTDPSEYQLKMFGAGKMFPSRMYLHDDSHVTNRNVAKARALAKRYGLEVEAEHLGGTGHREVIFDVASGAVWVQHRACGMLGT